MNTYQLDSVLQGIPRAELAHTPTPLEYMARLSAQYEGIELYVKRDDCTGLGLGGNKMRQIEFYLGDALDKGYDTVLSTGAVQSNYMRTPAAVASKLGLGYGQLSDLVNPVIHRVATCEGLLLDPVYSGKTFACVSNLLDNQSENLHTEATQEIIQEDNHYPYWRYASNLRLSQPIAMKLKVCRLKNKGHPRPTTQQ